MNGEGLEPIVLPWKCHSGNITKLCGDFKTIQSFSSVQKRSSEIFHFLQFYITLCPHCFLLIGLTTASLNVGWVPIRPGAFSCKSWQPSHESPHKREEGYPSHWCNINYTVETAWGDNPITMLKCKTLQKKK